MPDELTMRRSKHPRSRRQPIARFFARHVGVPVLMSIAVTSTFVACGDDSQETGDQGGAGTGDVTVNEPPAETVPTSLFEHRRYEGGCPFDQRELSQVFGLSMEQKQNPNPDANYCRTFDAASLAFVYADWIASSADPIDNASFRSELEAGLRDYEFFEYPEWGAGGFLAMSSGLGLVAEFLVQTNGWQLYLKVEVENDGTYTLEDLRSICEAMATAVL